ncbi:pyridoxal phosphate-dependent aminotransferase [Enemella dayhoffiae]|uniref:pyridoxal phosphate-dependent aminotransferase n=1 Tax=Enemella dayhoffiae TaxID=2016507 RepID=UPI001E45C09C|nr:pyridoxal phosphate-dependent aminotransferase [Enemella dayhoffiae]
MTTRLDGLSPTLAINEEIDRRRRAGLPVVPLGFGEANVPVLPELQQKLAEAAAEGGYGPVAGTVELREAAAGYLGRRGCRATADTVVAGPGSKPLLFALLRTLDLPVVLPRPSWVSYAAQARITGLAVIWVDPRPGQGGVPDPTRIAELAREHARTDGRPPFSVLLTLVDNPTGAVADPDTIAELSRVAEEHDLPLISDEIYRDLVHDPDRRVVGPAELVSGRTFVTCGLSKNLAVGGWRIGVLAVPDNEFGWHTRAAVLNLASEIWSVPPMPVQRAATWAFGNRRRYAGGSATAPGCTVRSSAGSPPAWPSWAYATCRRAAGSISIPTSRRTASGCRRRASPTPPRWPQPCWSGTASPPCPGSPSATHRSG